MRIDTPAPSLATLARRIRADWRNVHFAARPYLDAVSCLDSVSDSVGFDSGRSVVLYFLGNASTWRGPVAKEVKATLKALIK